MEDFESTPEFQALVVAATGKPERSMGDSVIPAEPPQWREVKRLAEELLDESACQLPLHVYRVQAETSVNGLTGLRASLLAMLQLLQDHWDELYPAPDLNDPDDMYFDRVNLVNELSEKPVFLDTIYRLPLVSVRGIGDFSTRDLDISAGTVAGSSNDKVRCQEGLIRGAFAKTDPATLQELADVLDALPNLCKSIEAVFAEKTGQEVLSLERLQKRVETCRFRFHEYADEYLAASPSTTPLNGNPTAVLDEQGVALASAPVHHSSLGSRDMVNASFNAILLYYQQHEPSSPVRVLTALARDIVNKSFFEVLQAMAPDKRDDLPALLLQLQNRPLGALINDSYTRYLTGESISTMPASLPESTPHATPDVDSGAARGSQTETPDVSSDVTENDRSTPVIDSRQQVLEVLQDIEAYFIDAEPASPIPLIVADIRKLVPKRFVELVAEFSHLLPAAATESVE